MHHPGRGHHALSRLGQFGRGAGRAREHGLLLTGEDALLAALGRHFAPAGPARIGIAVSGGSDSTALLHLAVRRFGAGRVVAATVDHGLRPASRDEAAAVAGQASALGIGHSILRVEVSREGNLQDAARRARYRALADWAAAEGAAPVALGHTADDQAETLLMRLSREAGLDGLAGMAPRIRRHGVTFARPFLHVTRAALCDWLRGEGIDWIRDPGNDDTAFERVRARQRLAALAPLGIDAAGLARVAANLGEARDALAAGIAQASERFLRVDRGDVVIDRAALLARGPEVTRRVLSAALRFVASAGHPPRREALAALTEALDERGTHTLHGCLVSVTDMTLRVAREPAAVAGLVSPVAATWDGRWRLEGPSRPGDEVRALGDALGDTPWRETGMPRRSLLASPAIWRGGRLLAAPVAGLGAGWQAASPGAEAFRALLVAR